VKSLHRALPAIPRPAPTGFTRSSTTATGSWPVAIPWASALLTRNGTTGRAQFKVDVGVSNVRKCYRVQLFVTKWSTVQSKASKGSNFAMDDTSKKSEPAVRRVVWGRQFLASTVVVPPDVAEHLNTDAMAVLAVIRNEAQASGKCSLPVARIAERANIGRAKARAAIRLAEGLGLIAIEETPDRKRVIVNRGVTSRC
jgi:hypothetical protein